MRMKKNRDLPRDPLTGETFKFIRAKKRFKKIIWLLSVIIVSAIAILFYFYANPKIIEKQALEKQLTYMKCTSLCPADIVNDKGQFAKICINKCYNTTLALLSTQEKAVLLNSEKNKAILKDYNFCSSNLKRNISFDYYSCFLKMFDKYKDIKDFTYYYPPLYDR